MSTYYTNGYLKIPNMKLGLLNLYLKILKPPVPDARNLSFPKLQLDKFEIRFYWRISALSQIFCPVKFIATWDVEVWECVTI